MDTKNWLERFEIKNKLHPTNRKTRKPLFVKHMSFLFHGQVFNLRCRTNSWIKTEKNLLIFREDQYLHCLREWKLRLHVQCFKRIEFFFYFRGRTMRSDVFRLGNVGLPGTYHVRAVKSCNSYNLTVTWILILILSFQSNFWYSFPLHACRPQRSYGVDRHGNISPRSSLYGRKTWQESQGNPRKLARQKVLFWSRQPGD